MTRTRRYGAAVIAAGLIFGVVGCSDSGESGSSDGSGPASQAAPALTKANFASELTTAQADASSAHIEATIAAAGQTGTMSGDVDGLGDVDKSALDMSLDLGGQQLQMVKVDQVLYVKGVGLNSDPAKPWVKLDVSDQHNPFSRVLDTVNPANFIAYFKGVTRFQDKGPATVNGEESHHYTVTVNAAKMLAANPAFKGQDVASLGLPDQITSDVFVNADNLPVKISVAMGSVASFKANFSHYGDAVDISAPPADQVSDFSL